MAQLNGSIGSMLTCGSSDREFFQFQFKILFWINSQIDHLRSLAILRSQLKQIRRNFLPHWDLNHDPLEPKASELQMSYADWPLNKKM